MIMNLAALLNDVTASAGLCMYFSYIICIPFLLRRVNKSNFA